MNDEVNEVRNSSAAESETEYGYEFAGSLSQEEIDEINIELRF